ncbi:DNA-binding protein [Adlercreutzia sp. ZJ141]|uniref:DNA-binding protein n=1 Tax=Adlercreutzia sp. ZJ141 TaxID=2709406 RepID=UPI0013EB2192|nr:DNA-binding protein [Adlercreutzia sp. ZJ141]
MVTFAEMVDEAGIRKKCMYTLGDVSAVTGVPMTTLYEEAASSRLRSFMPPGRKRGKLVRPEWVDEWMQEGISGKV